MLPLYSLLGLVLAATILAALAILVIRRREREAGRVRTTGPKWRPTVQHIEIPRPPEDPVIAWRQPDLEAVRLGVPPLNDEPLSAALRSALDGYALGRVKRILEAPTLLHHAAADAESWPGVEWAVQQALSLAQSHGITLNAEGSSVMTRALALCAAQGMLLAEWRQLEDGKTPWNGDAPQVRASDAFAVQRLGETMRKRVHTDLFAGIARRSATFDVTLLVPYCIAQAFTQRLRGNPPRAFAA